MLIETLPPGNQAQLIEVIKKAISRITDEVCKIVEKVLIEVRDKWVLRQIVAVINSDATIWEKIVKIDEKRKKLSGRIEEAYKNAISNIEDKPAARWSKACAFFKDLQ